MARAGAELETNTPASITGQTRTEVLGLSLNRGPGPWVCMGVNAGEAYGGSLGLISALGALTPSLLQEIPIIIQMQSHNKS